MRTYKLAIFPEIRHLPPDFLDKKVEITCSKHDQIDPTSTIKFLTKKQIKKSPMVGGTSISLEEELLDTKKPKARGVTKKAQTKIEELSK